ncbi:MAG: hypothetical protein M1816_006634 [Peltula sp. TS41687]|nr:MAG: hypothetical protein M1816_006634 [Peltula sp. TS41687]
MSGPQSGMISSTLHLDGDQGPGAGVVGHNEKKRTYPLNHLTVDAEKGHGGSSSTSFTTAADTAIENGRGDPPGSVEPPPRKVMGIVWGLVVAAILSSTFLFALDNTIVADVQPQIIGRFGQIGKLPWLSVAFLLGAVSTNLIWGKIYEQFNAKWLYIFNVFLFETGSAICGAANKMDTLIVGRAIAGVGGAGMYVGVMTLLSVTTTVHERPVYIGLTGLTWGAGTVLGPIVGGAFADSSATWRWAFYINLVIGAVVAPVYLFLLPSHDPRPQVAVKERVVELDYAGVITIVGAFISGVMAISFGGSVYEWNSGRIIGLFVCSAVLFTIFGIQQTFCILTTEERRIFPIQFLKSKSMLILFAQTACSVTAVFVPIYFIPLFFQFVHGDTALEAGVRLLPLVCLMVASVVANGVIMSKTGYYMPWYLGGGLLCILGSALMHKVDESSSTAAIYGYTILLGVGGGVFSQASYSVSQAKVKPREIPLAVGFITCAQIGGATIALSIANAVFLNQSTAKIVQIIPGSNASAVRGVIAGRGSAFFQSLAPDVRAKVLSVIVDSIGRVYILGITAGALAVVLSLFMRREKLFLTAAAAG